MGKVLKIVAGAALAVFAFPIVAAIAPATMLVSTASAIATGLKRYSATRE